MNFGGLWKIGFCVEFRLANDMDTWAVGPKYYTLHAVDLEP